MSIGYLDHFHHDVLQLSPLAVGARMSMTEYEQHASSSIPSSRPYEISYFEDRFVWAPIWYAGT